MNECPDCAAHEINLEVLRLTFAGWEGKIEECRRMKHGNFRVLKGKDLCINCLSASFATVQVLADQVAEPKDLMGRRLGWSTDDSRQGGVWPIGAITGPRGRRDRIILIVSLVASFIGFLSALAVLSAWLTSRGSNF